MATSEVSEIKKKLENPIQKPDEKPNEKAGDLKILILLVGCAVIFALLMDRLLS